MTDGCVRPILDSERSECLNVLGRAFTDDSSDYFIRYFEGDPHYKNDFCRVYVKDGQIVSSLHICRREVWVGCARLVMGGIANVGTDPDHRGRGYSSEVLGDSIRFMDADGMDFSILYTGINAFYDRLGWRTLLVPYLAGKLKRPAAATGDALYRIRPYDEEKDVPALLKVHDKFSGGLLMTAERDEFRWRNFTMHRFHPPWSIELAEDESGVVAYTMSRLDEKSLRFDELGFAPGHEDALGILMKQTAQEAIAQGADEVRVEPASHPAVTAAASLITDDLETRHATYGMVVFFNLDRTFRRLLPELNRRAAEAGLVGSVAIKTEVGDVTLKADGRTIELVGPSECSDEALLTQPDLTRLVFGIGPAQDSESKLSDGARGFLGRLFPAQPFVYWEADKF